VRFASNLTVLSKSASAMTCASESLLSILELAMQRQCCRWQCRRRRKSKITPNTLEVTELQLLTICVCVCICCAQQHVHCVDVIPVGHRVVCLVHCVDVIPDGHRVVHLDRSCIYTLSSNTSLRALSTRTAYVRPVQVVCAITLL
jgi:hypothetical protein